MKISIPLASLATLCLCLLCLSCAHDRTRADIKAHDAISPSTQAVPTSTPFTDPTAHYYVQDGQAVYPISREPEAERIRLSFVRWDGPENFKHDSAIFRVSNPGPRAVLIFNERVQTSATNATPALAWNNQYSDYPRTGLPATLKAGESAEFPRETPDRTPWRFCLLYSREITDAERASGRTGNYTGNYEVISPVPIN